jgi:hypothetical protein
MLRPKNPVSAGNAADNNSSFVSSSTGGSSALGRPSLLTDIRQDLDKKRQTPWNVSDSALRPISLFYPPLNPRCSTLITDSPPSVVALRISECLRKRSISVEFDEEMVSCEVELFIIYIPEDILAEANSSTLRCSTCRIQPLV